MPKYQNVSNRVIYINRGVGNRGTRVAPNAIVEISTAEASMFGNSFRLHSPVTTPRIPSNSPQQQQDIDTMIADKTAEAVRSVLNELIPNLVQQQPQQNVDLTELNNKLDRLLQTGIISAGPQAHQVDTQDTLYIPDIVVNEDEGKTRVNVKEEKSENMDDAIAALKAMKKMQGEKK